MIMEGKTVMWDCPYCSRSVPLAACIARIYDNTSDEFDGEIFRFFHLVCPYCGEEDHLSYHMEEEE